MHRRRANSRAFFLTIILSPFLAVSAFAENYVSGGPSYGVSAMIGKSAPSLAAKVSQGTDQMAKKIAARTASGQLNAEIAKILDDPRRFAPAPAVQGAPLAQQVIALSPGSTADSAGSWKPQVNNRATVRFPHPWQEHQAATAPAPSAAPTPAQDPLNEVLQRVHAMLEDPTPRASSANVVPPAQLAQEIRQAEERTNLTPITKPSLAAQLPAPDLGAGTTIPSDWESQEVSDLLSGLEKSPKKKRAKSDLSGYLDKGDKPSVAAPSRLLEGLGSQPSREENEDRPSLWKPKRKRPNSSESELPGWKNAVASGSTALSHARAAVSFRAPEKLLRVAKLSPLSEEAPIHRSSGHANTIHEISDPGTQGAD